MSGKKYEHIVSWIAEQVAGGAFEPGSRLLSENELCAKFGFSRQTVRRALEVLEQGGHITRVQGSGTFIAGTAAAAAHTPPANAASNPTIGIISGWLDDYIFPGIIRGIESVCTANGYVLQLISTRNEADAEARALQYAMDNRLAGLIIEPTQSGLPCVNEPLYREVQKSGIRLVFTNSHYPEVNAPFVALDDEAAGCLAANHLIRMGHRAIAGLFPKNNRPALLRYRGYIHALEQHALPAEDLRIHWYNQENMPQMLNDRLLWDCLSGCTAAVCYNDQLALKLIALFRERHLSIPEHLSLVAIDNSELARISALTSITHPLDRLGEAAATLLLSVIKGGEGRSMLFLPQLAVRGSVRGISDHGELPESEGIV
jgi:GntR family transcriptional regulator of arabinose operon